MLGRVVVTGLGCVSGFGIGVADFWVGLVEGRSAIAPLTGIENDLKIRIGATVRGYKPEDFPVRCTCGTGGDGGCWS